MTCLFLIALVLAPVADALVGSDVTAGRQLEKTYVQAWVRHVWKLTPGTWSNAATPRAACSLVERARRFRSLIEAGEFGEAGELMGVNPRRWWERRDGDGMPWTIGAANAGPWAAWDEHFRSEKEIVGWREQERAAIVVIRETNDFYRLLERGSVLNEITYFFDEAGKIEGLLIRAVGERPPGRTEEFRRWAGAHAPEELEAVMPGGEIDPSDPARFRRLLERWRAAAAP